MFGVYGVCCDTAIESCLRIYPNKMFVLLVSGPVVIRHSDGKFLAEFVFVLRVQVRVFAYNIHVENTGEANGIFFGMELSSPPSSSHSVHVFTHENGIGKK